MSVLRKPAALITIAATGLTLLTSTLVYRLMSTYYATHPLWVEQAAYLQFPGLNYLAAIQQQGRLATAWSAIRNGERHLLQPLVLALIQPRWLGWLHAHLLFTLPAFFVFLSLFGWTIFRRVGNVGYALAAMCLFVAHPGLLDQRWGLGTGFADHQSFLFLSSAALCLLNALLTPGPGWIRAFALLLALAMASRTSVVFHAVVVCGPMLLLYVATEVRRWRSLKPLAVVLADTLPFVGAVALIVVSQLGRLWWYYASSNPWQLRRPLSEAARVTADLLVQFAGGRLLWACLALLVLWCASRWLAGRTASNPAARPVDAADIAVGWWPLGFVGYLLAIGYTSDVPKEVMYALPGLVLLCAAPFRGISFPTPRLLPSVLIVLCLGSLTWNAGTEWRRVNEVSDDLALLRGSQERMAAALSRFPNHIHWQSYTFPDWGIPVSLLTYNEFGRLQTGEDLFVNRRFYWERRYPGLSPEEIQERTYAQTVSLVVVIVLKDPRQKPREMEHYCHTIAAYVSSRVQSDPLWRHEEDLPGEPYSGTLALYVNTRKLPSSFQAHAAQGTR